MFHLDQILATAVLIAIRLSGLMVAAPFFGSTAIPVRVKGALTVVLTYLLYPVVSPVAAGRPLLVWLGWGASEFTIGLLIGLVMQFVFEAVSLAGAISGVQLGFSLESIIDPSTQASSNALAVFYQMITLYIFLQMNIHLWILKGLVASFHDIPLGGSISRPAAMTLLQMATEIWRVGLQIALPILAITVLIDTALGFLSKAAPQLPVLFVGISVKDVAGLLVLMSVVTFWPRFLSDQFWNALTATEHLLRLTQ